MRGPLRIALVSLPSLAFGIGSALSASDQVDTNPCNGAIHADNMANLPPLTYILVRLKIHSGRHRMINITQRHGHSVYTTSRLFR